MSLLTSENIENYCVQMSTTPSADCAAIYDFTQKNVPMAQMLIGPMVGSVLGFLVHSVCAERVLEIGCFTGYSALVMAERLPSDGEVITLDINQETTDVAQHFWNKSRHGKKIKPIVGPALESLEKLKGPFDFIFIDADKTNYPKYFEKALELISPSGIIALDNCLRDGRVLEENPDEGTQAIRDLSISISKRRDLIKTLLPVRDGLLLVQLA
jgi:caffeoyl-CoA O-methyltransferase